MLSTSAGTRPNIRLMSEVITRDQCWAAEEPTDRRFAQARIHFQLQNLGVVGSAVSGVRAQRLDIRMYTLSGQTVAFLARSQIPYL